MHAEVLSWSSPWVLLNPLVFWYVAPVYAVHYIVFGDLVLRYGRSSFWVLYAFGCLTGMYEFAITKVYWSPPWNPQASAVLGVAWIEFLLIGFVWHAFMSFMMPFRLMQDYVFPGRSGARTARDVRWLMVLIPVMQGAMGLLVIGNVLLLLAAVLGSLAVVTAAVWLFVGSAGKAGVTRPEDLALSPKGRRIGIMFLAAVYIGYGAVLRTDMWGTGTALILPIAFYALLIGCAYALLTSPAPPAVPAPEAIPPAAPSFDRWRAFAPRYALTFAVAFGALAVVQALAWPVLLIVGMAFLIGGFIPALYLLPRLTVETRAALRRGRATRAVAGPSP